MDIADVEENFFATSDAKLHGGMCKTLAAIYCRVLEIFPILEAAKPGSRSGIQALCSVHVALEKVKNILQHCSECSKLYLAITGDSVLKKFEKARCGLIDSLRRVEEIVPQSIGTQIAEIIIELEGTVFSLDPSEKQVADDIIALLQQGTKLSSNASENNELETFHQCASKLGINSSKTALTERRALKKLIERARIEEDKRKESIVAYLLHLLRKYSKLFRTEVSDDNDSQGSSPCSPTVQGFIEDGGHAFGRQLSKLSSFNFKPSNIRRSWQMPVPPEELRCPISLQLMYDPVIISSGQTYERVCIKKWFSDGHRTCPKSQQNLSHLCLTPNYCVKGLIATWCEQNGVSVPDGPPESLDLNYFRLAISESDVTNSRSVDSIDICKVKEVKVVPLEESGIIEVNEEAEAKEETISDANAGNIPKEEEGSEFNVFERYESFLSVLNEGVDIREKCKVVEEIRRLLKDDEEARTFMGAKGFVEVLVRFLELAICEGNMMAQEVGSMAIFNLAVNNNRNKEMMLAAGILALLGKMMPNPNSHGPATALYLNISCLEKAKPIIASSQAVPFLIRLLQPETDPQCKLDALHALYNLSTLTSKIPFLLSSGIINGLVSLLSVPYERTWTEKSVAVLINIAANRSGKDAIISGHGLISGLAAILDSGEPIEQEQAVSCLLVLCNGDDKCSRMVLQEGVIPALVSISVNGTVRGREKAQKLLMLFREQRQRDPPQPSEEPGSSVVALPVTEPNTLSKSMSRRKMGKAWSFIWKNKTYSDNQC